MSKLSNVRSQTLTDRVEERLFQCTFINNLNLPVRPTS